MSLKSNIRIINLNSHKPPEYKEDKSTGFIKIGRKNDYPLHITDMYNKSSVNKAIIDGKVDYIVGSGIDIDVSGLDTEGQKRLELSIKKINPEEDFNEVMHKVCLDWIRQGRFAIEVIPNRKGEPAAKYHVPIDGIRANEDLTKFAYSPDWKNINKDTEVNREKGYKEWDTYDPNSKSESSQLFYYRSYNPSSDVYGMPEYQSSLSWIEVDVNISEYFYSLVKNNFVAGYILNVPMGTPDDELADKFEAEFKKKFNQPESAGEVMIVFTEEGGSEVKITPITGNQLDKQYEQLAKDTKSNIFTGHRVTSPGLFGVETDQAFGNRTEIREKAEFFQNSYVNMRQRELETQVNFLMGTGNKIKFKRMEPIGFELSEAALLQIMDNDELREVAGLPKRVQSKEFSTDKDSQEQALLYFSQMGVSSDHYESFFHAPVEYDGETPIIDEDSFRAKFQTPGDLSSLETKILEILKKSPRTTISDISEILGETPKVIGDAVSELQRAGSIEISEVTEQGEIEIERNISEEVSEEIGAVDFEVRYRYVTRQDVPRAQNGSRDFCRRLMALNRVYTRAEIDRIGALTGRNVWRLRGGWYNNPSTGVNTPFCRHIWQSELVRKK